MHKLGTRDLGQLIAKKLSGTLKQPFVYGAASVVKGSFPTFAAQDTNARSGGTLEKRCRLSFIAFVGFP
jgi:hypothetical protein